MQNATLCAVLPAECGDYSPQDELRDYCAEFPILSRSMPLPHFAALIGASDEAIELASDNAIEASYNPPPEKVELALPPESGALIRWRQEVQSGQRRKTTIDSLTKAACHVINAREDLSRGQRNAARQSRLKALELYPEALNLKLERGGAKKETKAEQVHTNVTLTRVGDLPPAYRATRVKPGKVF